MGGRGNGAARNTGSNVEFTIDRPIRGEYNVSEAVVEEAKDAIKNILDSYSFDSSDENKVDRIYDALGDYFPMSMPDDEADKFITANLKKGKADFVDFRIRDDLKPGKLSVTLSPSRADLDDFSDEELSRFNIKRNKKKQYEWL